MICAILFPTTASASQKEINALGQIRTRDLRRAKASALAGPHRCLEVI